jgi:hypothetical protein
VIFPSLGASCAGCASQGIEAIVIAAMGANAAGASGQGTKRP